MIPKAFQPPVQGEFPASLITLATAHLSISLLAQRRRQTGKPGLLDKWYLRLETASRCSPISGALTSWGNHLCEGSNVTWPLL